MNKKILMISVVFLAVALLALPIASALSRAHVEKLAVTHMGTGLAVVTPLSPPKLLPPDSIPPKVVIFYIQVKVPITLTIHSSTEEILTGESIREVTGIRHNKVVEDVIISQRTMHFAKGTWTFPGGTFEGDYIYVVTRPDMTLPASMKIIQMTLYGTGLFEGQTVTLNYDGAHIGSSFTGFLYRPVD